MIFKTEKDRINSYRNVFSSNEGRMVLVDILATLGFWEIDALKHLTVVEQNILNLYAKKILMRSAGEEFGMIVANMLRQSSSKKKRWFKWLRK